MVYYQYQRKEVSSNKTSNDSVSNEMIEPVIIVQIQLNQKITIFKVLVKVIIECDFWANFEAALCQQRWLTLKFWNYF